jgi:hypothetical protein
MTIGFNIFEGAVSSFALMMEKIMLRKIYKEK